MLYHLALKSKVADTESNTLSRARKSRQQCQSACGACIRALACALVFLLLRIQVRARTWDLAGIVTEVLHSIIQRFQFYARAPSVSEPPLSK